MNAEGYRDETADIAVARADHKAKEQEIKQIMPIIREIAALKGLEIIDRIVFRDEEGRIYR